MSTIGFNPATNPPAHAGCDTPTGPLGGGMPPAGMAFPLPTSNGIAGEVSTLLNSLPSGAMSGGAAERFVASSAGGVILDKAGAPAGRVPAGSFIDTKDGKVYGADGKAITLPEGGSVDFFDLPDLGTLRNEANGGGHLGAPGKSAVDGQWGPGGITPIKDGLAPIKGGGNAFAPIVGVHGSSNPIAAMLQQLEKAMESLRGLMPMATVGGGGAASSAVAGAQSAGKPPTLQSSLDELIQTLMQLSRSMSTTGGGGFPGQLHLPSPPNEHHSHAPGNVLHPGQWAPPTVPPVVAKPAETTAVAAATTTNAAASATPATTTAAAAGSASTTTSTSGSGSASTSTSVPVTETSANT